MPNSIQFSGPAANPVPARMPRTPLIIPANVAERAATRYVEDIDGCYISTYSVASHGYAQVGWKENGRSRMVTAHRASWVYANGIQIPEGMTIDHTCKARRCVNPNHLRMLSNFENARRTSGRDWPIGQCAAGHPNSELRKFDNGRIHCATCVESWEGKPKGAPRILREMRKKHA